MRTLTADQALGKLSELADMIRDGGAKARGAVVAGEALKRPAELGWIIRCQGGIMAIQKVVVLSLLSTVSVCAGWADQRASVISAVMGAERLTEVRRLKDAKALILRGEFEQAREALQEMATSPVEAPSHEITVFRGAQKESIVVPSEPQPTRARSNEVQRQAASFLSRVEAELGDYNQAIAWRLKADQLSTSRWCGTCVESMARSRWPLIEVWNVAQLPRGRAIPALKKLIVSGKSPSPGRLIRGDSESLKGAIQEEASLILGEIYKREGEWESARRCFVGVAKSKEFRGELAKWHLQDIARVTTWKHLKRHPASSAIEFSPCGGFFGGADRSGHQ